MLQRVPLHLRLAILCLLYAIPFTGIILYLVVSGIDSSIDVTRLELAGNAYQRPLEELLQRVPLYGIAPDPALKGEIDAAFGRLDAVQAGHGAELQVTDAGLASRHRERLKPATLRGEWNALAALADKQGPDWEKEVDALVADLRGLITHIGDTSTLILDPDLDSYYLMDLTLGRLPQTQDRLGALLRHPPAAPAEAAVAAALLSEVDLGGAVQDVATALNEDANFYGVSPSLQQRLPLAIAPYRQATEALISALGQPGGAVDLAALARQAREESFHAWGTAVDELDVLLQRRIDAFASRRLLSVGLTVAVLLLTSAASWYIVRGITRQAAKVADELGGNVGETLEEAQRLREASRHLSESAVKQAAALEQTGASLEEMSSMARQSIGVLEEGRGVAARAREAAESGTERMDELAAAIAAVGALRDEMSGTLAAIKDSNGAISKVIETINEIAFQTNVLALNAAVEAAHAGVAGAGFAVVADEVRNLAQRASAAASETEQLIDDSIVRSEQGVEVGRRVTGYLGQIGSLSERVTAQLRSLVGHAGEVDRLIAQVGEASAQQAEGVSQINGAVASIDQANQANSVQSEHAAEAAAHLTTQAGRLRASVGELEALLGRAPAAAPAPAPSFSRASRPPGAGGPAPFRIQAIPLP